MESGIYTEEDTKKFSKEVIEYLKNKKKKDSSLILNLIGDLGAGKTTFTKYLALNLGVEDEIVSPTFVLRKDYDTRDEVFKKLIHIDIYRIESDSELETIGFSDVEKNKDSLIVIEWGNNMVEKPNSINMTIDIDGDKRIMRI